LILHCGYASEVLGILDFFASAKYAQNKIVSCTRSLRARGKSDRQIQRILGLKERRPFIPDPKYLAKLTGFVSSRVPTNLAMRATLESMYSNELGQ